MFKKKERISKKYRAAGDSDRHKTERTPCKCFRCGSVDHLISKSLKPPKDNKKWRNTVRLNERGNHASQKESENGNNDNDQNIHASMAQMSGSDRSSSRYFGGSLLLIKWILYSGATSHMKPQVLDFILGSLEDTDKYIEFADGHHVSSKQKLWVQIKTYDNNRDPFIATFHNVILALDLCDGLFSIITLMTLGHTCLFHKGFCTV